VKTAGATADVAVHLLAEVTALVDVDVSDVTDATIDAIERVLRERFHITLETASALLADIRARAHDNFADEIARLLRQIKREFKWQLEEWHNAD
jgi:hypothetical protein